MTPAVDPKWMRTPADDLAVEQGCLFDPEAGQRVCDFIEEFCYLSQGRWRGKKMILFPWERDFVMRLYGWKMPDGRRRFLYAYLEVGKKNGKSPLISALSVYHLMADGEGSPLVHINACDSKQAEIVFGECKNMVDASPELSARLETIPSAGRIVDPEANGAIVASSKTIDSKDGFGPSVVVWDELHRQPDRRLWGVYLYASVAREQPLRIAITTAGEAEEGVWFEQRTLSEGINSGKIPDIRHLGVVYRADPLDDIDDPATWAKANPSMGLTIREDDFRRELEEAKRIPADLAQFMRLRLNIVVRGDQKFFGPGIWEACKAQPLRPLAGRPCWMGLDLSKVDDLCALATIAGNTTEGFDVFMKFWLPEDVIVELERKNGVPYRMWAEQGWITLTPGNVVDYAFIRREIVRQAKEARLMRLLEDPWGATDITTNLREQDGLPVDTIQQGFLSLGPPTRELLRLVLSRKIRHGGNPILNWHAGNAITVADDAGNIKLSKKKSRLKIDGLAALVNAVAGATDGSRVRRSVYDERGLLSI